MQEESGTADASAEETPKQSTRRRKTDYNKLPRTRTTGNQSTHAKYELISK
jgi:hypothetical protein